MFVAVFQKPPRRLHRLGRFLVGAKRIWYDRGMQDNEFFEFEDRQYLRPETSRDERLSFIDTLRQTQQANTAQVNADTYALGSQVPSNLGGLGGAQGTFAARYQTPQTNATVAQLREAAQAQALNTAMGNLTDAWKKRYQDAINNYRRRSLTPSTTSPKNTTDDDPLVDLVSRITEPAGTATSGLSSSQLPNTLVFQESGDTVYKNTLTGEEYRPTDTSRPRWSSNGKYLVPAGFTEDQVTVKQEAIGGWPVTKQVWNYYDKSGNKVATYNLSTRKWE